MAEINGWLDSQAELLNKYLELIKILPLAEDALNLPTIVLNPNIDGTALGVQE